MPNNSQVKLKNTQVEDHYRILSISNKNKSVTACNESLNSRTSNTNAVYATCKKCLVDSDHFSCVTKMLNDVNAKTKKPNVVPISTKKPKGHANKSIATPHKKKVESKSTTQTPKSYYRMLYEKTSMAWKWLCFVLDCILSWIAFCSVEDLLLRFAKDKLCQTQNCVAFCLQRNPNPFEDGSSQAEMKAEGTTDVTSDGSYCLLMLMLIVTSFLLVVFIPADHICYAGCVFGSSSLFSFRFLLVESFIPAGKVSFLLVVFIPADHICYAGCVFGSSSLFSFRFLLVESFIPADNLIGLYGDEDLTNLVKGDHSMEPTGFKIHRRALLKGKKLHIVGSCWLLRFVL
nr:hypothetical protein [Tanacetum cinerariifolium]